ncbi:MAG TPA: DUF669 domain-containing protein [Verrucomicrobiae bacterium]|nr:DUF669 domain-containing protein [Verrucomicrobiae bacterium]
MRVQFQDRGGFQLLEPGNYIAIVAEAREGTSNAGNPKIDLKLNINEVIVFDQLVFTENAGWKIDTFLKACGLAPAKGEFVELTADKCLNAVGRVRIGTKPGLKDPSKVYNCVDAWLCDKESIAIADKARDDIPF